MSRERQKFKSREDLKWWKTQKLRKTVQKVAEVAGKKPATLNPRDFFYPRHFLPLKYIPSPFYPPLINFEKFNEFLTKYQAKVKKWSYLKIMCTSDVLLSCVSTQILKKVVSYLDLYKCYASSPLHSSPLRIRQKNSVRHFRPAFF